MKRLAIVTTHPIQYYAPVFQLLTRRQKIEIKVFYTLGSEIAAKFDPGFNKDVKWDIQLYEGYNYEWVDNIATAPGTRSFNGIITPGLPQQIKAFSPDAILVFGWANKSHLQVLRHFSRKIPIYFRGDSTLLTEPSGLKKIARLIFLRWVYKHVDHAFYVGVNNKAYYLKYGLKESQLSFAPHAIDNSRFYENRQQEADKFRSSLNLNASDILIMYSGKFEAFKNVKLLISAFVKLDKPNVFLLLIGNGAVENDLKELAGSIKQRDNIYFSGFKNQSYMPAVYRACDLFCLPSTGDTWGLSINEAMACGKAILASTKTGCAANLVIPGENGDIFISENEADLLKKLDQLTQSKETLVKYGQRSLAIIQDWNFTNIAIEIENKLLSEKSATRV